MLRTLRIRNLAILPAAEISFRSGFTVLTGETGAGKSILLNALKLVLGAKAKADLIRQGEDKLRVEATFDLPANPALRELLHALELDADDELVIERELTSAGKSRARVNGSIVTLSDLESIGRHLVDLHGQHEQQGLLDAGMHGGYLDGYAGLSGDAAAYAEAWRIWRAAQQRLAEAGEQAERLREQLEFLQFQFRELDKAGLKEGEEERLEAELNLLAGAEKIMAARDVCSGTLEGGDGVLPRLSRLQRELQALGQRLGSAAFAAHEERVESARALLADVSTALRALDVPAEADPERIDALNARLALFQRLKSKYKTDMAGLLALRERRRAEIGSVENADGEADALRAACEEAREVAVRLAATLAARRREAAAAFDAEVNARLARLGMDGSRFETRFEPLPEPSAAGSDKVEFWIAANPGEPARPLRQTASGGEISRVMLAIKGALAHSDPRPLLVFDELDTGIGGQTALRVGEAVAELAAHHQLLVITHLHQVAARAAHHHKVEKRIEDGRTITGVTALSDKDRAAELARMMGGEESGTALKHAKELLRKAG